jgi:riboflavin biosynthesis pyrimidine reductase
MPARFGRRHGAERALIWSPVLGRSLTRPDGSVKSRHVLPIAQPPPLELLFEAPNLPGLALPSELSDRYRGTLGFRTPTVIANFVESVDGVVALPGPAESGKIVSLSSDDDRFVMGLLRACSDVVVVGAGTFNKTPGAFWYPESIYPQAKELFTEVRRGLGLSPHPTLVLVTGTGSIDATQPAVAEALVVTTRAGEARLRPTLPASARLWAFDGPRLSMSLVIGRLHAEGARTVLTEGGPTLVAQLIADGLLNELFLTVSPALFGRFRDDDRKALVEGLDLGRTTLELLGARRAGSHLFLRYRLGENA